MSHQCPFQTLLNEDCRFMIYEQIFSDHTIDITKIDIKNCRNQSPILSLTVANRKLKNETEAWAAKRKL